MAVFYFLCWKWNHTCVLGFELGGVHIITELGRCVFLGIRVKRLLLHRGCSTNTTQTHRPVFRPVLRKMVIY